MTPEREAAAAPPIPVAIVGGGPVGLATALGLAHHGVRSVVIERDLEAPRGSRAFGIWGRTLELLQDWGLERAFVEAGDPRRTVAPHDIARGAPIFTVDFTRLDDESGVPGLLLLPQSQTEGLLRDALAAEPLAELVEADCLGVRQDQHGVDVLVRDAQGDRAVRALYAVAADGSRSAVRESLGMRHQGDIISVDLVVCDVELDDAGLEPIRLDARRKGLRAALKFAPGQWRVLLTAPSQAVPSAQPQDGPPPRKPDVPAEQLAPHLRALFGERDHRITWQSQTTLYQQRIPSFRAGRVALAGDSAHLISPAGGQGMNQGMQDAENLSWTLAAVLSGADADHMLDGYDAERRAIADLVARRALINSYLEFRTPPAIRPAAFLALRTALRFPPFMRFLVRRLSMRDLAYRRGARFVGRRRAVGKRVPDVTLGSGERLSSVVRGRPAVIAVGRDVPPLPPGVSGVRVKRLAGAGGVRTGDLVVVRPDRHIGAVLRGARPDLAGALRVTCGVSAT